MSPLPPAGVWVCWSGLWRTSCRALQWRQATTRASPSRAAAPERRSTKTSRPLRPSAFRSRISARLSWGPAMRLFAQLAAISIAVWSKCWSVTPFTGTRTALTVSAVPSPSRSALFCCGPRKAPAGAAARRQRPMATRGRLTAAHLSALCSAHNPLRVALPLPVRADGPARAAPEVQGLGAWGALVPREPARAHGRLWARVLDPAQGGDRRGLRALPDRGPDRVGVLLPGAAGRRPEP